MKIAIDYRLANSTYRGMGKYCREIVKQLAQIDSTNQYVLIIDRELTEKDNFPENFKIEVINCKNYFIFEQYYLSEYCRKNNIEILWSPYNTFPLFLREKIKLIVTIHDLIFLDKKIEGKLNFYQLIGKIYRKYCVLYGKQRIDKCVTVSSYSKEEIQKTLKISEIEITYNKIQDYLEKINKNNIESKILQKYGLKKDGFYFTVSGDTPNKNLKTLVDIFETRDINKKLVVAGIKNYEKSHIYKLIKDRGMEDKFVFCDYLENEDLMELYKNCSVFLFLSFSEGFGIPLLEAMVFGCKIIASNRTSIPEVLGKGGISIDPLDKEKIYEEMIRLSEIQISSDIKEAQKRQIEKYSDWKETAEKILKIMEN